MADSTTNTEILKCKLESDKKWSKMDLELQKIRDDVKSILEDKLPTLEARLNKQALMVQDIQQIALNVASLSQNMQQMLEQLKVQNERLTNLEQKPVKRFDNVLDTIIKLVITAGVTAILIKIGLQ